MPSDNKSTLVSSPVTVSADTRKWVLRVIIALGMIVGVTLFSSLVRDCNHKQDTEEKAKNIAGTTTTRIPLASAPIAEWPKLVLEPGGSEQIPVLYGMQTIVEGSRADIHTVYADGSEHVVLIESGRSNPDGQIVRAYVTNRMQETNIVSYAFAYSKK